MDTSNAESGCMSASTGRLSVAQALQQMSTAVQNGDFALAESIGTAASFPLAIKQTSFSIKESISEGAQATVHAAVLDGHGPVAIKRGIIREPSDLIRLRREVIFLSELQHNHIVQLIGARMLPPNYQILLGLEATNAAHELYSAGWRPGWPGALAIGAQIAAAVAHMHAHDVIHRDIKPANILLSSDRRTSRLADLGISQSIAPKTNGSTSGFLGDEYGLEADIDNWKGARKPSGGFHNRQMIGTLEYMGPELLMKNPHSPASDVFALAVTINEIASASVPYSDCTRDNPLAHTILEMGYGRQELAAAVAAEGLRPTVAPGSPPAVMRLLRGCWDVEPERRPSAAEMAMVLADLAAAHPWQQHLEQSTGIKDAGSAVVVGAALVTGSNGKAKADSGLFDRFGSLGTEEDLVPPSWAAPLLHEAAAAAQTTTTQETSRGVGGRVAIGSFATAGARGEDRMEDRCSVLPHLFGIQHGCSLAAVFDGHRGAGAAEYLSSMLERHLESLFHESAGPGDLLRRALLDADEAFRRREDALWSAQSASVPDARRLYFPGSTAIAAMLVGLRCLAVANVGDSRAVLCRNGKAVALSRDQTADREDERSRVEAAGGKVKLHRGEWRVGAPGLAVTRSIGDADLKECGVIADAEIVELDLSSEDSFLILASDGVWDLVTPEDAVKIVLDTVKQPAMCAQRIVLEALTRGSKDNVSVVVMFLPEGAGAAAGTAERVYHAGKLKYKETEGAAAARIAARKMEDD